MSGDSLRGVVEDGASPGYPGGQRLDLRAPILRELCERLPLLFGAAEGGIKATHDERSPSSTTANPRSNTTSLFGRIPIRSRAPSRFISPSASAPRRAYAFRGIPGPLPARLPR